MKYRTRTVMSPGSTSDVSSEWWPHGFLSNTGLPASVPSFDTSLRRRSYTKEYSVITDQAPTERGSWNDLDHRKVVKDLPVTSPMVVYSSSELGDIPSPFVVFHIVNNPWWGTYGSNDDSFDPFVWAGHDSFLSNTSGNLLSDPPLIQTKIDSLVSSMLPILKSELSLVNSLIELKDFVTLKSTITKTSDLIGKLSKADLSLFGIRKWLHTGADNFLQWKFNVSPTISDVNGIYRSLASVEKKFRHLINNEGRTRIVHRTIHLNVPEPSYITVDHLPMNTTLDAIGKSRTGFRFHYYPTVLHVEMEYNYWFYSFQREHAHLLALLDMFGVNFNPRILWNAIPWSFTIDWLIGVGRWLDQFKVSLLEPLINIQRCLWSVKRIRTCHSDFSTSVDIDPNVREIYRSTGTPSMAWTETSYKRRKFMPSVSSIELSGLSSSEVSLGAALAFARKPRHKR